MDYYHVDLEVHEKENKYDIENNHCENVNHLFRTHIAEIIAKNNNVGMIEIVPKFKTCSNLCVEHNDVRESEVGSKQEADTLIVLKNWNVFWKIQNKNIEE